jgi:hypothetical protein
MAIHDVNTFDQSTTVLEAPIFGLERLDFDEEPTLTVRTTGTSRQRTKHGSLVRCAKSYRTTDPFMIGEKLREAGFEITKNCLNRVGNVALLEARFPHPVGEPGQLDYIDYVKFYLDHRGRKGILLQAGALRCACSNQFMSPGITIHHCSREADRFLADPAEAALNVRFMAGQARAKLEALRGRLGGRTLLEEGLKPFPRLQRRAFAALPEYDIADPVLGGSTWAALQAMTATHAPKLVDLTCKALGAGYDSVCAGRVPDSWAQ